MRRAVRRQQHKKPVRVTLREAVEGELLEMCIDALELEVPTGCAPQECTATMGTVLPPQSMPPYGYRARYVEAIELVINGVPLSVQEMIDEYTYNVPVRFCCSSTPGECCGEVNTSFQATLRIRNKGSTVVTLSKVEVSVPDTFSYEVTDLAGYILGVGETVSASFIGYLPLCDGSNPDIPITIVAETEENIYTTTMEAPCSEIRDPCDVPFCYEVTDENDTVLDSIQLNTLEEGGDVFTVPFTIVPTQVGTLDISRTLSIREGECGSDGEVVVTQTLPVTITGVQLFLRISSTQPGGPATLQLVHTVFGVPVPLEIARLYTLTANFAVGPPSSIPILILGGLTESNPPVPFLPGAISYTITSPQSTQVGSTTSAPDCPVGATPRPLVLVPPPPEIVPNPFADQEPIDLEGGFLV